MKTILIAHNYTQGSFAFMSYSLAHYLANRGCRVIFISHKPFFKESFREGVDYGELIVYSWPTTKRPTSIMDALWFLKIYMRYKPETIISHFVNVNITVFVSKIISGGKVKTLPYYHTLSSQIITDGNKNKMFQRVLEIRKKLLYKFFCSNIICPSDVALKDLSNYFGIKKGIKVLNPMQDRFCNKEEIFTDKIQIVYLGRIDISKGVIEMIEAFDAYLLKFPDSKIKIKIAGSGSQIKKMFEKIKNNNRINYVGSLEYSQIDKYLNQAHYTIIPSKYDALNMVGIESLMNQTPLLITNTTGLSEELTDGYECYKFNLNTNDMISLFEKVENTIHLQKEMGINARKTYLNKFSVSSYYKSMDNLI